MRSRLCALALALAATVPLASQQPQPDAIVAADGSGSYKTVQEAIDAVPQNTSASNRWTILIKAGTYRERVYVQREKRFFHLVGEDADDNGHHVQPERQHAGQRRQADRQPSAHRRPRSTPTTSPLRI